MGNWMRARGVGPEEVDEVVDRLVSDGVLDDARYAYRYAEDKRQLRGWGRERIRLALLDRGISPEDAEVALMEDEKELERAVELLRRRGRPLADAAERQRALGMLVRRGYESEVAYEAIRRLERG
jgi:regulatory protein